MPNEQQIGKKPGRPRRPKKLQLAERLTHLLAERGAKWPEIAQILLSEGYDRPLIEALVAHDRPGPAAAGRTAPEEGGDMRDFMAMQARDILERVQQAEIGMAARTKEAIDTVQELARVTGRRGEALDQRLTTLTTQVGLLTQLLQRLDPARIDEAVEALQGARSQFEAPPLRQTVRQAAAEIRAGERPPRRKLGVTVDGSLWAAVEEVQRRRRWTISQVLDEALQIWLQHEGEA